MLYVFFARNRNLHWLILYLLFAVARMCLIAILLLPHCYNIAF